jgi:hypothetical protein
LFVVSLSSPLVPSGFVLFRFPKEKEGERREEKREEKKGKEKKTKQNKKRQIIQPQKRNNDNLALIGRGFTLSLSSFCHFFIVGLCLSL